ncbi:SRPBCC family protein [Nocardia aurantia]|uniref:hypothetical protein n=1 Tax=Nocardia aurantia TaxID=2585199 RepID=UPI0012953981|nr:hypothetical protein [Nocardia aurantia]
MTEADLPITIAAPRDEVWAVYSDIRNDIGRHPFLKDVVTHRSCEEDGVRVIDFTALEDIPMGPVTFPGHTQAQQRIHAAEHYYTSDSWDVPDITTHQRITFTDNGDGTTTVDERLTFLADPALIRFTADNGTASHRAYQLALKRDIENGRAVAAGHPRSDVGHEPSAPRPATTVRQRGLGGALWGQGPNADEVARSCLRGIGGPAVPDYNATLHESALAQVARSTGQAVSVADVTTTA